LPLGDHTCSSCREGAPRWMVSCRTWGGLCNASNCHNLCHSVRHWSCEGRHPAVPVTTV
jgi:hypothetical protein